MLENIEGETTNSAAGIILAQELAPVICGGPELYGASSHSGSAKYFKK